MTRRSRLGADAVAGWYHRRERSRGRRSRLAGWYAVAALLALAPPASATAAWTGEWRWGLVVVASGLPGVLFLLFAVRLMLQRARRDPVAMAPAGPLDPVVVCDGSGDPEVWLHRDEAVLWMAPPDVENGEYRMFLPTGEVCQLSVAADRVQATPTGRYDRPAAIALMRRAGYLAADAEDLEGAVWRVAHDVRDRRSGGLRPRAWTWVARRRRSGAAPCR